MKKSLLEIYGLAVCFFCVACFVVTLGFALYDIVQIANPDFTRTRYDERYLSNEEYRHAEGNILGKNETERAAMSEEEVTKRRETEHARVLRNERHGGEQSLLRMVIVMLIDIIAFVIHWQIAKRARQSGA